MSKVEEILGADAADAAPASVQDDSQRASAPARARLRRSRRMGLSDRPTARARPACSRCSTTAVSAAPATCRFCRSIRASSIPPARRSRKNPDLLRSREHREAGDRRRLQRRRLDARRARRGRAQVRAQDSVPAQVQPQRVPLVSEQLRSDPLRQHPAGVRHGRDGRRRDDLFRLGGVEAPAAGSDARCSSRRTSSACSRCCGATCATPRSRRRTPTITSPPT